MSPRYMLPRISVVLFTDWRIAMMGGRHGFGTPMGGVMDD